MKTIKIFLASSEELDYDRMAFGNLVRRLDDMYEKRGIRIKLFEWEDYDSAYNDRRKQDEYNDHVRQSDIFLALFYKKAGKFTIEEFDIASQEFEDHASPKVYTYCKDLKPSEEESPELKEFKERLFNEMGHYWCRYDNRESLQFQFVMQLQLVESNRMDDVKVEEGVVTINGLPVAKMENLKFAACNERYQEMNKKLASFPEKIAKAQHLVERYPEDEDLKDDLQLKLNEFNQLKKEFAELQQFFFETAKRISQLQGELITNRLHDAINAFNEGRVHDCNLILDIAKEEARRDYDDFNQSIEITEIKRQNVICHITEKRFNASSILADAIIPIEERIKRAEELYEEAYQMANDKNVKYPTEKFIGLLFNYSSFLQNYALYYKAIEVYNRLIKMCEESYGNEHPNTASSYNNIGLVYANLGDYDKALKYYRQAMIIREKVLGKEHPDTASSYNNIGIVYSNLGDYDKALENHQHALDIKEKALGKEHPDTATSYNNIGNVYSAKGDYDKALEYYLKAVKTLESVLGESHPDTATSYNNIGNVYKAKGDYDKALEYYLKAVKTLESMLGESHPDTAKSYTNIGNVYKAKGDYDKALEYYLKAVKTLESMLGESHPDTAKSYNNIGNVYSAKDDYDKALEYYLKAVKIRESVLGESHPDTAKSYSNLGNVYKAKGDYDKAIEYYKMTLEIQEKVLGKEHPDTAWSYKNIAWTYHLMGKYKEALPWAEKAVAVFPNKPRIIYTLATVYQGLGRYDVALVKFELCLKLYKEKEDSKGINRTETKIGELKKLIK